MSLDTINLAKLNYDADSIVVLSGLEAVRRNPGMYIGSVDSNGINHLAKELIDNVVDEVGSGGCNLLKVILKKDNSCVITDNGRGIPVAPYMNTGKPTCEILLTTLHSGSKFHKNAYTLSTGLHGVGLSCVNALSEWLILEVWRDGGHYKQSYSRGLPVSPLQKLENSHQNGTRITFLPDSEIFAKDVKFSVAAIEDRLNELAFLHPELTIEFEDERTDIKKRFQHRTGVLGLVRSICHQSEEILSIPIYIHHIADDLEFELGMQWTKAHEERVLSYVNSVRTSYGGQHEIAMRAAITAALNDYAIHHKLINEKTDNRLSLLDVFDGAVCVLSVKMQNPLFEGQIKLKLTNASIHDELYHPIYSKFYGLLSDSPQESALIIKKILNAYKARIAAWHAADYVAFQNNNVKISEKTYQKQFGIRSKNWHDSATWITHENLLNKHVDLLEVNSDSIALDVCCGSGVVGASFKPKVSKVIGLDLTPEMINLAKSRLDEVYQGNVYNIPFPDNSFDLVITREVLHLFPNPERPISEIYRVLKPNGQFIFGQVVPFSTEDAAWMYRIFKKKQPLLYNMFQEEDYCNMLHSAGFKSLKKEEINVWESIDVWINTHETTALHRYEIKDLFHDAPAAVKNVHPFKISPSGEIQDLWRWIIFSVKK